MKVLLLGASGFLGRNLLPLLLQDSRITHITATIHKSTFPENLSAKKLSFCPVETIFDTSSDTVYDVVICLAGNYSPNASDTILRLTNFEIPKKIIDAFGVDRINHFILASSINVRIAKSKGYAYYKKEAETYLISSGIQYTIFRPALIFGNGDTGLSKICSYIKKYPIIPVFGDGEKFEQPINVKEAASFFYEATLSSPVNQILEIGGLNSMTYNQMLKAIARVYKKDIRLLHIPASPIYRVLSFLEYIGLHLPISSEQILHIDTDLNIDNSPALNTYRVDMRSFEERVCEYIDKIV